jgi:hypothetical protein
MVAPSRLKLINSNHTVFEASRAGVALKSSLICTNILIFAMSDML